MAAIRTQQLYHPLLPLLDEGVFYINTTGHIVHINKSALSILELYKKDAIGKHIDSVLRIYIESKLILRRDAIAETVLIKGQPFTPSGGQLYVVSRTGKRVPVTLRAYPFRHPVNPEIGGVVLMRDMTKEESLARYREDTIRRLHMLTPILQKMAVGDFSQNIDIPNVRNEFTELLVALRIILNDLSRSQERAVELSPAPAIPSYEAEGWQLIKMAGRKTSELKEAKSHMEMIIENLSSGLIEFDAGFRVRRMNASAEEMLGVSRQEVVGHQITPEDLHKRKEWEALILISFPILDASARKLKKEVFGKDTSAHLITVRSPYERQLEVITIPLVNQSTGVREGFIKVLNDVTRERMISKSKSEFISVAAHQLRTPLSGLKWVLRFILDEDAGPINEEQRELLTRGYETNEKMIRLVNDLLNVARIEDGRFGYEFKVGDLGALIESLVQAMSINAQESGVTITFEKEDEIPPFKFDPAKMELAIQNLLSNAVKYTPRGGSVTVRMSKVDRYVQVEVSDTGIGIPASQLPRMFSKFFRAENAIKTQVMGSGLGLFIVKNIITRHGGRITVKSKENEGTTFTFIIPLDESLIPQSDNTLE